MTFLFKKILVPLVLASFLLVVFSSFTGFGADGRMQGDCPLSATGMAVCPPSALAMVAHHISAYQSFVSVPMGPTIQALISALILSALLLLTPSVRRFILKPLLRSAYAHSPPSVPARLRKITRWLSLLENSPSFR